ncbi:MAG: 50S ribosomal protein L3 [Candidatus Omnitrophica bacterium]|nr:50S ribosomal protein L3 [Candidatus Omnitrophota bacterium]
MSIGLLAKKIGMTELFNEHGRAVAVTVLQAGPCTVTQVKDPKRDGYRAVQVGFEPIEAGRLSKPLQGLFKKAGTGAFRYLREFRLPAPRKEGNGEARQAGIGEGESYAVGQQITVGVFKEGELVDITGTSIGKGFQGGVKRWHWKGGPATHGSTSHRAPGSIGSTTSPGRVIKGHHLPGHMGHDRVTVQNVRIMKIDPQAHAIFLQGAVPGPERQLVTVKQSIKKPGVITAAKRMQEVVVEEEERSKGAAKAKAAAKKK